MEEVIGKKIILPEVGRVYRHYKGNYYIVEGIATHSETGEPLVVYRPLYESTTSLYARPAEMFFEAIPEGKDNITGQMTRFALVEKILRNYWE